MDVTVRTPVGRDGDEATVGGPPRDGPPNPNPHDIPGDNPGTGGGPGAAKRTVQKLEYRSFSKKGSKSGESQIQLVLKAQKDTVQDVVLKPQGPDGSSIGLALPVREAFVEDDSGAKKMLALGSDASQTVLKDVELKTDTPTKVTLMVPSGYKARIEVI